MSDLIQLLASEFNKCKLNNSSSDPDEWFIELNLIQSKMMAIDSSFEKKEMEVIANIIDKLPVVDSEVVTIVKAMTTISLNELKSKIRAFYKRKLKGTKSTSPYSCRDTKVFARTAANKGVACHVPCAVCQSKMNTSGTNANGTNKKMRSSAIIAINMSGILQETAQNQNAHCAA